MRIMIIIIIVVFNFTGDRMEIYEIEFINQVKVYEEMPWIRSESRYQWMFWNLPWLPVTKLFEVINEIKSKKLEHEKPEDYKEKKTQLVAQTEMNANIGKI